MSLENRGGSGFVWAGNAPGLSESESYREHQAALDATIFGPGGGREEVVLELQAGELRMRGHWAD